jgi:hypothetical protein
VRAIDTNPGWDWLMRRSFSHNNRTQTSLASVTCGSVWVCSAFAVYSIPIARSTPSQPWPLPANGTTLASACNSWPALADVGRGFTRSLVRMTRCDPKPTASNGWYRESKPPIVHFHAQWMMVFKECHVNLVD